MASLEVPVFNAGPHLAISHYLMGLHMMESSRTETVQVKQFQGGGQSLGSNSECWVR